MTQSDAYTRFDLRPISPCLGAEIRGVEIEKELDDATFGEIERAFLEHGVIAIRDQRLDRPQQIEFARRFGDLDVHPIAIGMEEHPEVIRVHKPANQPASFGTSWHTDNTFFARPSKASVLYAVILPPIGGDTLWASTAAAYDALSPTMQRMLEGLSAVHSAGRAYDPATTGAAKYRGEAAINYRFSESIYDEVEHPVLRTHPETGRKCIFVNPMFTQRIVGLRESESRALLEFLYAHCVQPELTCRVRWEPGTVVVWDNRSTLHYAMNDYVGHERLLYRVTVAGDVPV
jgi:taurine dioxygenase